MNIIDIIMKNTFETANEAYEYMYNEIITNGIEFANTKALFNIGFTIENPTNKVITNKERNWNEEYAAAYSSFQLRSLFVITLLVGFSIVNPILNKALVFANSIPFVMISLYIYS